ncbi:MurR/RpiR family transcriptional regulator [Ligilactobacillus sp. WILCCON 0076]|uniref:MurR/RpiR family transcriptional regulator n=1 Tax=Ligilactobacillus ubinensis TaxID=2876789 RepID=A0A9X2FLA1_9LACO|nr:MurR/RpiR family transcriptional regulator [Ligilactobacillus ubinensis]MCP0887627.1 MurR/RpiR family transcriptional regulator [Ligilactobacillus ubinensis]
MESKISERIIKKYPKMGESSKRLADYIVKNSTQITEQTLAQLAENSNVSLATVSRFAKDMGYHSFSQFKWALSNQVEKNVTAIEEISEEDSPKAVVKKVLSANIETLTETFDLMDDKDLYLARDLIVNARSLSFFGMGGSNIVAFDAYHRFLRVPLPVLYNTEYHMALMQASKLNGQDCAIIISHTGSNKDTLIIAETLKKKKVPMIIITSTPKSTLTNYGDVCFFSISKALHYRSKAFLSMTSQLAITECLYMVTAQYFGKNADNVFDNLQDTITKRHS